MTGSPIAPHQPLGGPRLRRAAVLVVVTLTVAAVAAALSAPGERSTWVLVALVGTPVALAVRGWSGRRSLGSSSLAGWDWDAMSGARGFLTVTPLPSVRSWHDGAFLDAGWDGRSLVDGNAYCLQLEGTQDQVDAVLASVRPSARTWESPRPGCFEAVLDAPPATAGPFAEFGGRLLARTTDVGGGRVRLQVVVCRGGFGRLSAPLMTARGAAGAVQVPGSEWLLDLEGAERGPAAWWLELARTAGLDGEAHAQVSGLRLAAHTAGQQARSLSPVRTLKLLGFFAAVFIGFPLLLALVLWLAHTM